MGCFSVKEEARTCTAVVVRKMVKCGDRGEW